MMVPDFFPLEVMGTGTEYVESLTSYITRLAAAHRISSQALLALLNRRGKLGFCNTWSLMGKDSRAFNSYGSMQQRICGELSRATLRNDLLQTCLAQIRAPFPNSGQGVVKWCRHWCPQCIRVARSREEPAYDLLAWQIVDLGVCIRDGCLLQHQCPHCGQVQRPITDSGLIDICHTCKNSLASEPAAHSGGHPGALSADQRAYWSWLSQSVRELLLERESIAQRASGRECSTFLKTLLETRQLSTLQFCRQLGMNWETVREWVADRHRPRLVAWFRFCSRIGVPPAATLMDPVTAAYQFTFPFEQNIRPEVKRPKTTKKHYPAARIRAAVQAQLDLAEPTVKSNVDLTRKLKISECVLYWHAGPLAKQLSARLKELGYKRTQERRDAVLQEMGDIMQRLQERRVPVVRKIVIAEVVARIGCSAHLAKEVFSHALRQEAVSQHKKTGPHR